MSNIGDREIATQQRVTRFFRDALGYRYLGFWKDREGNSNVEEELLTNWLKRQHHNERIIRKVLFELDKAKAIGGSKTLYDANQAVYGLLRYGVKVKPGIGEHYTTVWLVDWNNFPNNDFAIAEEVTVAGVHEKRPDIVLYVNGIAIGVLELKRSTVSVTEGIRQNLDNQKKIFIKPFFSTVQLVMAGNETEGMRYGVIETPEKYYLRWKETGAFPEAGENPLLRELGQMCRKDRLLEIVHDFMVFDAGTKKTCRHNQYFGVKAAQKSVKEREGGIIWHTQGSGKSLIMVWLAKWIRENVTNSRVLIITDRTELDEQIEMVFKGVSEAIYRTRSGADLVSVLNTNEEWLICSLIHKFGAGEDISERDLDDYIEEIRRNLPKDFSPKGEIFTFVDECHRTQSGKLHEAMKTLLPGTMLIGFTGTPLLKADKKSIEVFGPYIHTYKYDEAVRDGVVLDLQYEARDIDQSITSQDRIDQWFEIKTQGLTDFARAQLKQRWGTMQKVLSSHDRLKRIVNDILLDMEIRDRLKSGHGNALLVSGSIYSACRFFEMFQNTDLAGKCAIITSYKPAPADIKGEDSGEGLTEKLRQYEIYRKMLADHFDEPEDTAMYKVDQFEQEVKKRFIKEPGQMKLLIVVDKLLTGFDAPPATYLYIDKQMRDHGLFQAICRVNRLDGEDKEYGYIIDYKDLFNSLEKSIKDYTGEAFDGYDKEDVVGLLKDRLTKGRQHLEEVREAIAALCEPVEPPREMIDYLHYFCAQDTSDPEAVKENEPRRVSLYKLAGAYLRAYASLANEMREAGYTDAEAGKIKDEVTHYDHVRQAVMRASGDEIDLKRYEPAMRHLLDTYIRAEESEKISSFDDLSLIQLVVERGIDAVDELPESIRKNPEAVAETIENNVRKLITDESPINPKYYEKMSELLDTLIKERRAQALGYREYLKKIVELTRRIKNPSETRYPESVNSPAKRALYDNLGEDEAIVLMVHEAVLSSKQDDWKHNPIKTKMVQISLKKVLQDQQKTDDILELVKNQQEYS